MIVDALAHVTRDGRWFDTSHAAGESDLLADLDRAGVGAAVICGLPGFTENRFILEAARRRPDRFIPVGSFDPTASGSLQQMREAARGEFRDTGLVGVKLHPRLNGYDLLDAEARAFLEELSSWETAPVVWVCSFLHHGKRPLRKGVVETLHEVAVTYPAIRFVFAHAGGPDCLRLATAIRACRNVMLDLSYTLVKYAGSSIDSDLRHLLDTFDRRLMFGSDFPEVAVPDAVTHIRRHLAAVKPEAASRVLAANLSEFLSLSNAAAGS